MWAQETRSYGGAQSFGVEASWSGTSSHILLGDAEERRIWTLGFNYTYLVHVSPHFRWDYEAELMPVWEERDPTIIGTTFPYKNQIVYVAQTPERVTHVYYGPIGSTVVGSGTVEPLYAVFGKQYSYAAAISPLGARVTAFPRWRVRPTLAVNLGFVVSPSDLPVDGSDQFNYMFALGPGIQIFADKHTSWHLEYIYRHTSNAGEGNQNPGVDQGVIRVTLELHR